MKNKYDVLIIGGGPAGLSVDLAIGRMGKSVLLCDDGRPRNTSSQKLQEVKKTIAIFQAHQLYTKA